MKPTLVFLLLVLFFLPACDDTGNPQIDGDQDQTADGDRDADENADTDDDVIYEPCALWGLNHTTQDNDEMKAAVNTCESHWWRYPDAEGCYEDDRLGDGTRKGCCPSRTYGLPSRPAIMVCEATCGECGFMTATSALQWPGPGYGCFEFPGRGKAITGWHYLGTPVEWMQGDGGCLNSWTDEKLAFILDRSGPDATPCESITDLTQCLGTHNPPAHCQAVLGWPLDMLDENCQFDSYQLDSQADLDRAQFIGCTTVYEYKNPLADTPTYSGVIKKDADGGCLYFSGYDADIPTGYSKAECAACGK